MNDHCFSLRAQLSGLDETSLTQCHLKSSIYNLCRQFLTSVLSSQTFENAAGLWTFKTIQGTTYPMFHHHISVNNVSASARSGCQICTTILKTNTLAEEDALVVVTAAGSSDMRAKDFETFYKNNPERWSVFNLSGLRKFLNLQRGRGNDFRYEFIVAKDNECTLYYANSNRPRKFPSLHPNDAKCHEHIAHRYSFCITQHKECIRSKRVLPLRVLDVYADDNDLNKIALRESKQFEKSFNISYVALSYCWGEVPNYSTVTSNISERLDRFDLREAPAVVQDAISVVRRLNIQFLWVDAFCICQDDLNEWKQEAAQMANIYGLCLCIIGSIMLRSYRFVFARSP